MNNIFWAITALLADIALFASGEALANSLTAFFAVGVIHSLCCAILASCAFLLLPARYRKSKAWAWLLMFDFSFIAPVVGPIGILLIIHFTLIRKTNTLGLATPRTIELPVYDVQTREVARAGQGTIRSRLTANVPANVRMQSLLTLQVVPSGVANPILESLLGDKSDDVRLVAFGMLDAAEKKLSVQIHRAQKNLEKSLSRKARYDCYRHLAELHLELVRSALVQGEMRKHVLSEALQCLVGAMSLQAEQEAGMLFLEGRIFFAHDATEFSEAAFKSAMRFGQSEASVLPYLAELAFNRRDLDQVREYMRRLMPLQVSPRTDTIIDLWTGRDHFQQFRDIRILQHI
jgi:polysaccharide biosynthesis protein PelE